MNERLLQTGQRVHLELVAATPVTVVEATVTALYANDIVLSFPGVRTKPAGLYSGAPVILKIGDVRGIRAGETRVARVLEQLRLEALVEHPNEYLVIQNRKFFRVAAKVNIGFSILKSNTAKELPPSQRTFTEDISAGGVRFMTVYPLAMHDEIEIEVTIPLLASERHLLASERSAPPMKFLARVVRSNAITRGKLSCYMIAVEFQNVHERERERLVKLMFALQRRLT